MSAAPPEADPSAAGEGQRGSLWVRWYVVCPLCGKGGLRPSNLRNHLRSSRCREVSDEAVLARCAETARRDPRPWEAALAARRAELASTQEELRRSAGGRSQADLLAARAAETLVLHLETEIARLQRIGPDGYEIPRWDPWKPPQADGE